MSTYSIARPSRAHHAAAQLQELILRRLLVGADVGMDGGSQRVRAMPVTVPTAITRPSEIPSPDATM
jgi:hypothetical protein